MNLQFLKQQVKAAKRDGLTLQWSIIHLTERLERNQQRITRQRQRDQREGDTEAQQLQLENEALALVLTAVIQAFPAGADITID
jgi:hypothetical protein